MRKVVMMLGFLLSAFVLLAPAFGEDAASPPVVSEVKDKVTVTEQTYKDYRVRITKYPDPQLEPMGSTLEIFKGGTRVFKKSEWRFYFGHPVDENGVNDLVRIGTDITGNGEPNLVVSEWTGGAHCCFSIHVFEIGEEFKHLATIDVKDSDLSHFEDRDGDANLEFVLWDCTFAYWNESFADSPAPKVVLRYEHDGYHVAEDQMREDPPPDTVIRQLVSEIADSPSRSKELPPTRLWGTMLDWIYVGNADAAWRLFDLTWRPDRPGKDEFLSSFKTKLKESPWWPDIEAMNARPAPETETDRHGQTQTGKDKHL